MSAFRREDKAARVVGPRVRRTVLVTGGAGFVGAALVRKLVASGARVRVLDDLSTGRLERLGSWCDEGSVEFVRGSTLDRARVARLCAGADVVYHLAAVVGVARVVRDAESALRANVNGARIVFTAAAASGARVLFASSSEVYGRGGARAMREDDPLLADVGPSDRWSYAVSKLFGERLLAGYAREGHLRALSLRFFNTTGAEQGTSTGMVLPSLAARAAQGAPLPVHGDGTQVRSFCSVDDVARALVALLDVDDEWCDGRALNVGSEYPVSMLELAQLVASRTASPIEFVPYRSAFGPGFEDVMRRVPDTTRLRELIGWRPEVSLEQLVDDVVAAERSRQRATGTALAAASP